MEFLADTSLTNKQIAERFGISEDSVRRKRFSILGNRGKSWTKEREDEFIRLYVSGMKPRDIRTAMSLTPGMVSGKIRDLRKSGRIR
jgi:DNA-binding CsgD family transcriptional regulator